VQLSRQPCEKTFVFFPATAGIFFIRRSAAGVFCVFILLLWHIFSLHIVLFGMREVVCICWPSSFDQGVDNKTQTQDGGAVQDYLIPDGALFLVFALVPVGLVIGKAQQNQRCWQKNPAIPGQPHGEREASQAETGQDQGKLSAHRIGKGRGHRTPAGKLFFHRLFPTNGFLLFFAGFRDCSLESDG